MHVNKEAGCRVREHRAPCGGVKVDMQQEMKKAQMLHFVIWHRAC